MKTLTSIIMAVLIHMAVIAADPAPITITASPRFGTSPQWVKVKVRVEPHADNRILCVGYVGTRDRESCEELQGDRAAITHWVDYKDLPGGRYTVYGRVVGVKGRDFVATAEVCVQGGVREGEVSCSNGVDF